MGENFYSDSGVEEILLEVLLEARKIYVCSLEFRFDALDFQKLI